MTRTGKFVVNKLEKTKIRDDTNKSESTSSSSPPAKGNTNQLALTRRLELALSLVNRLLIGFVTIYMCWMCLRLSMKEIPWHAVLCTLGFVCLMSEGLMAHYHGNAGTQACYRTEKTRTHWILQLFGSVIGLAGIGVKVFLEEIHFHSLHGQLGLAALILCLMSFFTGLSSLYSSELKVILQPLLNKAFHNILGLAAYTTAMLSMFYAFDTDIFMEYSLDAANFKDFRLLIQIIVISILILSSYGPAWCLIYSKLWKCC